MGNQRLSWFAAAIVLTRLGAFPAVPNFDSGAVPLPPLSLHEQADSAVADQLARRLAPDAPAANAVHGLQTLHRAAPPIDHMPIARGQSIDPQMVHAPDDRYDYKLIIVAPGEVQRAP